MYNKIILVGNLTRDIELKYTQSGTALANTAIATTKKFTSNGEKKEEVCFVDITFFGRSAEVASQYLRKGSKILVEGRLKFDMWEKDGQKKSKHSVSVDSMQMLDSKSDNQSNNTQANQGQYQQPQQQAQQYQAPQPQYQNANGQPVTQQQYQANQGQQPLPQNNAPTLDINEDEIPF